jgi:hypothetical protein
VRTLNIFLWNFITLKGEKGGFGTGEVLEKMTQSRDQADPRPSLFLPCLYLSLAVERNWKKKRKR